MAAKLFQCLRMALVAASLYGYLRFAMGRFRLSPEQALPVVLAGLGLGAFVAGLLGLLLPGSLLLLALGLGLAVMSLVKREGLRPLLTPGMLAFMILAAFSAYIVLGQVFFYVDDFSHWATAVKEMLLDDGFPDSGDKLVYFPNYPLGSSVLIYWAARMAGINSEWFQMLIQALLICACLASLFSLVPRDRGPARTLGYMALGAFCLGALCSNIELTSLYVDDLLALLGLAAVGIWAQGRGKKESFIPLMLLACYVSVVKQSGVFFSLIIVLLLLADRSSPIGGWRKALILLAALAALKLAWSVHVDLAFPSQAAEASGGGLIAVFPGLEGKTREDIITIIRGMTGTVLRPAALLPVVLSCILAMYMARSCGRRRTKICVALAIAGLWLAYCIGQGAMYVFFMARGEAVRLAAFDRYFATIQLFTAGAYLLLLLRELSEQPARGLKSAAALGLCALLGLCAIRPQAKYLLRMELREPSYGAQDSRLFDPEESSAKGKDLLWAALRGEYDRLIDQYAIPQGLSYTVFVGQDYGIEARLLTNYLLSSAGTYICTDEQIPTEGENCLTYDYYIVLEETEANMALIQELFGTQARAGYTY